MTLRKAWMQQVTNDRLFRNSTLLMVNTGVGSLLGFAFWSLAARTAPADEIGRVTSTVSLSLLVTTLGGLGLSNSLIRFLARRPDTSRRLFVDAMALTQTVGVVVVTLLCLSPFRPAVATGTHAVLNVVLVYALMSFTLAGALVDATLLCFHRTRTIVVKSLLAGSLRLALLLVPMAAWGDLTRLLAIQVAGMALACLWGLRTLLRHDLSATDGSRRRAWSGVWQFSLGNHLGLIAGILPSSLAPLIVLRSLGSAEAAYFSISAMVLALVNVVASATGNSLFNEAQHGAALAPTVRAAARGVGLVLVPSVVLALAAAPWVLLVFGPGYEAGATPLLRLMLLAALPAAASYLADAYVNARGDARGFLFLNLQNALIVLVGVTVGSRLGLTGVGWGWLLGQSVSAVVSMTFVLLTSRGGPPWTVFQPLGLTLSEDARH